MSLVVFVLMIFVYGGAAIGYWLGKGQGAAIGGLVAFILLVCLIAWMGRPRTSDPGDTQ